MQTRRTLALDLRWRRLLPACATVARRAERMTDALSVHLRMGSTTVWTGCTAWLPIRWNNSAKCGGEILGLFMLHINKNKFVKMLWDRGYKTSAHSARFYTVPPERSDSHRLEWFLAWNTPVGNFEARIHRASPWRPMLWVKRQGVVIRAESLPEGTLRQYGMIGGNESERV